MEITVRILQIEDIGPLAAVFSNYDKNRSYQLFEKYHTQQQNGELTGLVAILGANYLGYLTICWNSSYDSFSRRSIPEIKDLNVLPHFRGKGYGAQLMDFAEELISEKSDFAGIGVGLYSDCGTAQRMYVRRGYVPDGLGLMYKYQKVEPGSRVKVDDELTIMLSKRLQSTEEDKTE
jgi:GNAT superfamily N-acetyltransferase